MKTICKKKFNEGGVSFEVGETVNYIYNLGRYFLYDSRYCNLRISPEYFGEHFETKSEKRIRIIDSL